MILSKFKKTYSFFLTTLYKKLDANLLMSKKLAL